MPIPLQYEISTIGQDRLRRVFRSIESEAKAHVRRFESATGTRRTTGGRSLQDTRAIRGMTEVGRVARRAEHRRHVEAIRNRDRESRRAIRGLAEIGRVARREEVRRHREAIRNAERERLARRRAASRVASGAVSRVGGAVRGTGLLVAGAAATGGLVGGLIAERAVSEEVDIVARASRLANQAGRPELKQQLAAESRGNRGFTGAETLAGLESFVDITGDLDAARGIMGDLSKLALATGTNLDELAAAAGNAFIPLKDQIADPEKRLKALRDTMATVAAQGAVGAVEIKDLATEMAGLAATANRFRGDPQEVLGLMGAMAQASRQRGGSSSAAEAVTSVARFSSDVIKTTGQKRLKKLGVNVFADKAKTQLKDPREIIIETLKATGGDLSKLTGIFGERGIRAVAGFSPVFTRAEARKKGSGEEAVRKEFDRLLKVQLSDDEVEKRFQSRIADPDIQLKEGMKEVNRAIATELLPVVVKDLIPAFKELAPHLGSAAKQVARFVEFMAENPLEGLGAIVLAKVGMDLLGAGIGAGVRRILESVLNRVRPPPVTGTGGGGGGGSGRRRGRLGGALRVAGALGTAGLIGYETGTILGRESGAETADPRERAIETMRDLDRGALTGDELLRRKVSLERDQAKLQEGPGMIEQFFGGISSVFGGKDAHEANRAAEQDVHKALKEINARISEEREEIAQKQLEAARQQIEAAERQKEAADAVIASSRGDNPRRTEPILRRGG